MSLVILLNGCQHYQPAPLVPSEILTRADRERHEPAPENSGPFTFTRAVELLARSPTLRQSQAEYQTALALAHVKTPFPNPSIEAGPRLGFGQAIVHKAIQPFGAISFTIPLGKRLRRQDELNRISAEMARVEFLAQHREQFLELRRQYARLVLARQRLVARNSLLESQERSLTLTRKMLEAGQINLLDNGLLELESGKVKADVLSAQSDEAAAEADLSQSLGVDAAHFAALPDPAVPDFHQPVPEKKDLMEILLANNLDLARLRAKYDVTEAQLRLEIAKQYPDLRFNSNGEGDIPDPKTLLGLTLGIDLPIFDRNQQAIATALKTREQVRVIYEAAAHKALAQLDRAWRLVNLAAEREKLLNTVLLPKAKSNTGLARKTLEAGGMDMLRYLESERSQRAVLLDSIESGLGLYDAWISLEAVVGYPLLNFPGEQKEIIPPLKDWTEIMLEECTQ